MQFRDLQKQYEVLKPEMDAAMTAVASGAHFISGEQVKVLEERLAAYVGRKHCITCGNGTDALELCMMAWGVGPGDAVFVPDFTFFASGEVVSSVGGTPVFYDVCADTFNADAKSLEAAIEAVIAEGKLTPKAVVDVDLFGLPADHEAVAAVCKKHDLLFLEDAAQGFGGMLHGKRNGAFGDAACTSFFPAKPLGCYGDGGAVFTDSDETAAMIRSLCVHGKGSFKYDNVRIGMNSRLDTIQAAILLVKMDALEKYELADVNAAAAMYNEALAEVLPKAGIELAVIPRAQAQGEAISASHVRQLIHDGQIEAIRPLVPETTYAYLTSDAGQNAVKRIQASDDVIHH